MECNPYLAACIALANGCQCHTSVFNERVFADPVLDSYNAHNNRLHLLTTALDFAVTTLQAPDGYPPDVSLQLQERMHSCPACNQGTMPGAAAASARHGSQARTPMRLNACHLLTVSVALEVLYCAAFLLQHFFR